MNKHCPRTKQYQYKGHTIHTITKGFWVQALVDGGSCGFYADHDVARCGAQLMIENLLKQKNGGKTAVNAVKRRIDAQEAR
jgi:hypothetical protein